MSAVYLESLVTMQRHFIYLAACVETSFSKKSRLGFRMPLLTLSAIYSTTWQEKRFSCIQAIISVTHNVFAFMLMGHDHLSAWQPVLNKDI